MLAKIYGATNRSTGWWPNHFRWLLGIIYYTEYSHNLWRNHFSPRYSISNRNMYVCSLKNTAALRITDKTENYPNAHQQNDWIYCSILTQNILYSSKNELPSYCDNMTKPLPTSARIQFWTSEVWVTHGVFTHHHKSTRGQAKFSLVRSQRASSPKVMVGDKCVCLNKKNTQRPRSSSLWEKIKEQEPVWLQLAELEIRDGSNRKQIQLKDRTNGQSQLC